MNKKRNKITLSELADREDKGQLSDEEVEAIKAAIQPLLPVLELVFKSYDVVKKVLIAGNIDRKIVGNLTISELRNIEKEAEEAEITLSELIQYYTIIEKENLLDYEKAMELLVKIKAVAREVREEKVLGKIRRREEDRLNKNANNHMDSNSEAKFDYDFSPINEGLNQEQIQVTNLTKEQCKLVKLIIDGLSNKQIGERLSKTEGTIKNELKEIYQKVGIEGQNKGKRKLLIEKYRY